MMEKYSSLLNNPPEDAKGCTRWWWYGCAVTREGIKRQLEHMKNANIGSVEIQVVYPLSADDPELGIKNIDYFSPEFFDMLKFTAETTEEMNMKVDFTLGSSWPYGGPFITHDMSAQQVIPYQIDLFGPCSFSHDFTTKITGKIIKAIMGRMEHGKMLEQSVADITDRFVKKYLYGWEYGSCLENLEVPEGDWKITVLYIQEYKQLVGIPAPNMAGFAMDHCRKDVADYFFKNAGQPIVERLGASSIRSFFCDSIEVAGHNWTEHLPDEFYKRRGYDLTPYIYALWGEIGDITHEIRYDYYRTMSELTLENFFFTFAEWCRSNGSYSRVQAHGTWADILKAYASADIPEGETFGEGDRLEVNTVHRRLASSAGHIYGKPIISNESFTWLRMPRYTETLEQMKAAVDAIFIDGINMIINHGYAYTPEAIEAPGWPFYASSHISHPNTWWPYYKELGRYIQVVCAFLRRGRNVAEVAVYLPQADIWSQNSIGDLHLAMKLEEYIGSDTTNNLSKSGYYFDYINDEALNSLGDICEEGLNVNGNIYKVIILPEVHRMPMDSALKLKEFVEFGGTAIAACCVPDRGCGLLSRGETGNLVRETMLEVFPGENGVWTQVGRGRTNVVSDKTNNMVKALNEVFAPDLFIQSNNGSIGYVHRLDGDCDIYFVSNISESGCSAWLKFKKTGKGINVVDPLSGEYLYPQEVKLQGEVGLTSVRMEFKPFQSLIFILDGEVPLEEYKNDTRHKTVLQFDISDKWHFFVPSKISETEMDLVYTWEKIKDLRYYTGQGIYSKTVLVNKEIIDSNEIYICFEDIGEVAEIWVNESLAGVLWKAPRELDIKLFLKEGVNNIIVKVVNLWINDAINPDRNEKNYDKTVISEWPYFAEAIDHIRRKRLHSWREKEMVKKTLPSGIGGRVILKYEKA